MCVKGHQIIPRAINLIPRPPASEIPGTATVGGFKLRKKCKFLNLCVLISTFKTKPHYNLRIS